MRNDAQRQLLDEARRLVGSGALIPPRRNYRQQLKVYESQTREAGLYRMHGLRHDYALRRYEELTGWKAPAAGGPPRRTLTGARRRIDTAARMHDRAGARPWPRLRLIGLLWCVSVYVEQRAQLIVNKVLRVAELHIKFVRSGRVPIVGHRMWPWKRHNERSHSSSGASFFQDGMSGNLESSATFARALRFISRFARA